MKLRFRANSLRLRVNQKEVAALAAGHVLEERVYFPGGTYLSYVLRSESREEPQARFAQSGIHIGAPQTAIADWAGSDEIGLYFTLETGGEPLKVAIEKDLECIDGPLDEKDLNAFPREVALKCC